MAKQTFRIEGLKELKDALDELPKATSTNVLKRALMRGGEPIKDTAQRLAPRLKGKLQSSITVGTKLSRRQKSQHVKGSKVEVFVGPASSAKSITQEFGAAHHAPKPYLRPAWDGNKTQALENIRDDIKAELDKAVARLARKAARLAAR